MRILGKIFVLVFLIMPLSFNYFTYAQKSNKQPPLSSLDKEALSIAQKDFEEYFSRTDPVSFTKNKDSWFICKLGTKSWTYYELRIGVPVAVEDQLTEADKLNGFQWQGQIGFPLEAYRFQEVGLVNHPTADGWGEWKDGYHSTIYLNYNMYKQNGKWGMYSASLFEQDTLGKGYIDDKKYPHNLYKPEQVEAKINSIRDEAQKAKAEAEKVKVEAEKTLAAIGGNWSLTFVHSGARFTINLSVQGKTGKAVIDTIQSTDKSSMTESFTSERFSTINSIAKGEVILSGFNPIDSKTNKVIRGYGSDKILFRRQTDGAFKVFIKDDATIREWLPVDVKSHTPN